ncbi:MAG: DUF4375 domain-containing protein, partial [Planctomycetales bacterium]
PAPFPAGRTSDIHFRSALSWSTEPILDSQNRQEQFKSRERLPDWHMGNKCRGRPEAHFRRLQRSQDDNSYRFVVAAENGKDPVCEGRAYLSRIEDRHYLTVGSADNEQQLPRYNTIVVDEWQPKLQVRILNRQWLFRTIKADPTVITHQGFPNGDFLVTATTEELKALSMDENPKEPVPRFRRRPRTPKEDIAFLRTYWNRVVAMLAGSDDVHFSRVLQLPQPWRALYTTFILDAEVRNGGFHQYFWNTEGVLNATTEEDLGYIAAVDIQQNFRRAVACFVEFDLAAQKRRGENTREEFTAGYKTIPWDSFDTQFYETSPTLFQHVARYVREHHVDFDRNG